MWVRIHNLAPGKDLYYTELEDQRHTTLLVGTSNNNIVDYLAFAYNIHGNTKNKQRFWSYSFDDGVIISELRMGPQKPLSEGILSGINLTPRFEEFRKLRPDLEPSLEDCLANLRWPTEEEIKQLPELARALGL